MELASSARRENEQNRKETPEKRHVWRSLSSSAGESSREPPLTSSELSGKAPSLPLATRSPKPSKSSPGLVKDARVSLSQSSHARTQTMPPSTPSSFAKSRARVGPYGLQRRRFSMPASTPSIQVPKPEETPKKLSSGLKDEGPNALPAMPSLATSPVRATSPSARATSPVSAAYQQKVSNFQERRTSGLPPTPSRKSVQTPNSASLSPGPRERASPRQRSSSSPRQRPPSSPRHTPSLSPRQTPSSSPRQRSSSCPRQRVPHDLPPKNPSSSAHNTPKGNDREKQKSSAPLPPPSPSRISDRTVNLAKLSPSIQKKASFWSASSHGRMQNYYPPKSTESRPGENQPEKLPQAPNQAEHTKTKRRLSMPSAPSSPVESKAPSEKPSPGCFKEKFSFWTASPGKERKDSLPPKSPGRTRSFDPSSLGRRPFLPSLSSNARPEQQDRLPPKGPKSGTNSTISDQVPQGTRPSIPPAPSSPERDANPAKAPGSIRRGASSSTSNPTRHKRDGLPPRTHSPVRGVVRRYSLPSAPSKQPTVAPPRRSVTPSRRSTQEAEALPKRKPRAPTPVPASKQKQFDPNVLRENQSTGRGSLEANPLQFDPTLRKMLTKVDQIKTYRRFQKWKRSFLERYLLFLESEGVDFAESACADFGSSFGQYKVFLDAVEKHVDRGNLSTTKKTVKAALALNEMCNSLRGIVGKTEALIPATAAEEKQRRYNKYQLGAVLVRDNFTEYDLMKSTTERLSTLGTVLGEVADKQQLELFQKQDKQFQKFCEVMADLGLYEVMLLCRKFAVEPDEEETESSESESELEVQPDTIIFVDTKTASLFGMERSEVVASGALTQTENQEYLEQAKSQSILDTIVTALKRHPTLGIAQQLVVQKSEVEEVDMSEAEAVANLWGIKLKRRSKNAKGEEFLFVDPKTGAMGELSRKKYIEKAFITPEQNENNSEILKEAETDTLEYDNLVGLIRKVLKIDFD